MKAPWVEKTPVDHAINRGGQGLINQQIFPSVNYFLYNSLEVGK